MKGLWACAIAIVLLATSGLHSAGGRPAASAPGAPQAATFKSGVDLVSFAVTVTDKKGEFVTDLKEPDFEVYEDGVRQTLKYFSQGAAAPSPIGPLHLGVLFDISGSMDEDMKMSRTAAIKFLKALDDADDMTLVDFDTEIRLARYVPADFPSLVERIRSRKADGFTALYDAVAVYLRSASTLDGRKILVFYTDGGDNDSSITFGDVLTLLKASDVTVYTIGFLQHAGSATMELRSRLERMAETTGGQSFAPLSLKELDSVYEKVRTEIRAQYAMGYVSTNTRQDGTWRKVEIKVPNGGRVLKIRTRKGYFAPYKAAAR
ncbi:MAG: VWA domain-containing protein [Bacteroidales bacterium]